MALQPTLARLHPTLCGQNWWNSQPRKSSRHPNDLLGSLYSFVKLF
jgi:hypothetical protein